MIYTVGKPGTRGEQERIFLLGSLALAPFATDPSLARIGETMDASRHLADFRDQGAPQWFVVNDGVMGGLSRSEIRLTEEGTGMFSGVLSLENSGGFASLRTKLGLTDLSGYAGMEIRVRGDGRTYQLRLRSDDRFDGVSYRTLFETRDGEWLTIRRKFSEFEPTFRGRKPRGAAPLDPSRIHQMGLLVADKQPGAFRLEIDYIGTWSTASKEDR